MIPVWCETRWRPGQPWCRTCHNFHPRGQLDALDVLAAVGFALVLWWATRGRPGAWPLALYITDSLAIGRCVEGRIRGGMNAKP
jgi:hypothetical protein